MRRVNLRIAGFGSRNSARVNACPSAVTSRGSRASRRRSSAVTAWGMSVGDFAFSNVQQSLAQLWVAASQPALSEEDTAIAATRQPLIAGEVDRLSWPALRDRVRRAALADDKPAAYLYVFPYGEGALALLTEAFAV